MGPLCAAGGFIHLANRLLVYPSSAKVKGRWGVVPDLAGSRGYLAGVRGVDMSCRPFLAWLGLVASASVAPRDERASSNPNGRFQEGSRGSDAEMDP